MKVNYRTNIFQPSENNGYPKAGSKEKKRYDPKVAVPFAY